MIGLSLLLSLSTKSQDVGVWRAVSIIKLSETSKNDSSLFINAKQGPQTLEIVLFIGNAY